MTTYKITQDDGTEWGNIEAETPEAALLTVMRNHDMTRMWTISLGAGSEEFGSPKSTTATLADGQAWHAWFYVRSADGVEMLQATGR